MRTQSLFTAQVLLWIAKRGGEASQGRHLGRHLSPLVQVSMNLAKAVLNAVEICIATTSGFSVKTRALVQSSSTLAKPVMNAVTTCIAKKMVFIVKNLPGKGIF